MDVVIPAAGLGKRFAGERYGVPKELLPLGPLPLLGHALHEAARAGFARAVVVVSPAKRQIGEYLRSAVLPLPAVTTVQPTALGIGDAVLRCWDGKPVGVLLPDDVVLETNHWVRLIDAHMKDGAAALCVRPVPAETIGRFGIAEVEDDRVVTLIEKPGPGSTASNLAIFGRYVVTDAVISGLRQGVHDGEAELTFGFAVAAEDAPGVRAVKFEGRIFDCGTPSEYEKALREFPL